MRSPAYDGYGAHLDAQRDTPRIKSNSEVADFGNNRKSQKYLGNRLDDDTGRAEDDDDDGKLKVEEQP